jgi:predicted adenine nucleotide alpha hydrolase (AANH) superfamily ATPase
MNENINYNILMKKQIEDIKKTNKKPKLLLLSCCAPCSSYVLSVLKDYFKITVLFYNPNIYPKKEFTKRLKEVKKLINILNKVAKNKSKDVFVPTKIKLKVISYNHKQFLCIAKNLENLKEGGNRCFKCYALRLNKTANFAKRKKYDYFATTLTVSPYKNAKWINEISSNLSKKYGVKYLYSDFKKDNGFKTSIELSKKYNLYRQDYCGCEFSLRDKNASKEENYELVN